MHNGDTNMEHYGGQMIRNNGEARGDKATPMYIFPSETPLFLLTLGLKTLWINNDER